MVRDGDAPVLPRLDRELTDADVHDDQLAERVGGEYHAIHTGSVLNFVENPETVPDNVREIAEAGQKAQARAFEVISRRMRSDVLRFAMRNSMRMASSKERM